MPRLPEYSSQITPQTGGVAPGSTWSPPVHADDSLVKAGKQLQAMGEQAAADFGRMQHADRVVQSGDALAKYYEMAGTLQGQFNGATGETAPADFKQAMIEKVDGILQEIPEQNRAYVASHIMPHVGQALGRFNFSWNENIRTLRQDKFDQSVDAQVAAVVNDRMAGHNAEASTKEGALKGFVEESETLGHTKLSKGEAWPLTQKKLGHAYMMAMADKYPKTVQQMLETDEGIKAFGLTPDKRLAAKKEMEGIIKQNQQKIFDSVLKVMVQNPNAKIDPVIYNELSGGQQMNLKNIQASGPINDQEVWDRFQQRVSKLSFMDTTDSESVRRTGEQLFNEIAASKLLTTQAKIPMYNKVSSILKGEIGAAEKNFELWRTNLASRNLTRKQWQLANIAYTDQTNKQGSVSLPPNATFTQRQEHWLNFLAQGGYNTATVEELKARGTGGVLSVDEAMKLMGGKGAAPAADAAAPPPAPKITQAMMDDAWRQSAGDTKKREFLRARAKQEGLTVPK